MNDHDRPRDEVISELETLRKRVSELEAAQCQDGVAETALQESENRLRTLVAQSKEIYHHIFDSVADGLLLVDRNGRITEADRAACQIYGYSPEELVGREVIQLIRPDHRHLFGQVNEQILAGTSAHVEAVNLHKDGSTISIELHASLFEFDNKKQALCVVRDLTARKKTEQALDESEKRFRLAFEEGPLGMVIGNTEGQIVQANHALGRMLGYSVDELEGRSIDDLTHPDDRYLNHWFLKQLSEQPAARPSVEKRYLRKDREVIWGRVTASLLPMQLDDSPHAFAMIEDITDRKTAQQAVEKEQRHLKRLLEMLEHDRQLVAYEIHDGFVQSLVGARMLLDMPRKHIHSSMIDRFEKAVDLLDRGIDEARQLISGQRPLILDERGLMAAIEHLVCERQIEDGPEIVYQDLVSFDRLAPPLETAVFRVVQEGLNNAERHSQSPKIRLRVTQVDDRLRIEIQDRGVGFDPTNIGQGCFGLEGLRERARIFGGTAKIDTAAGVGTTVVVEFPIFVDSKQKNEA